MKKLVMIAVLLVSAMSAQAALEETVDQLRKRFGHEEPGGTDFIYEFHWDGNTYLVAMAITSDNPEGRGGKKVSVMETVWPRARVEPNGEPDPAKVRAIFNGIAPGNKWVEVAAPYGWRADYGVQEVAGSNPPARFLQILCPSNLRGTHAIVENEN
jgi:hypothetical protein